MLFSMAHCNARTLLGEKSLRVTGQRLSILDHIITSNDPISANDLHELITGDSKIDLATVYRVLKVLLDHKIIREVLSADGVQFYELSCMHNPVHPHFRCENCGKISCLDPLTFEDTLLFSAAAGAGSIKDISVTLTGVCSACLKQQEETK